MSHAATPALRAPAGACALLVAPRARRASSSALSARAMRCGTVSCIGLTGRRERSSLAAVSIAMHRGRGSSRGVEELAEDLHATASHMRPPTQARRFGRCTWGAGQRVPAKRCIGHPLQNSSSCSMQRPQRSRVHGRTTPRLGNANRNTCLLALHIRSRAAGSMRSVSVELVQCSSRSEQHLFPRLAERVVVPLAHAALRPTLPTYGQLGPHERQKQRCIMLARRREPRFVRVASRTILWRTTLPPSQCQTARCQHYKARYERAGPESISHAPSERARRTDLRGCAAEQPVLASSTPAASPSDRTSTRSSGSTPRCASDAAARSNRRHAD